MTSKTFLTLTEKQARGVAGYCRIAKANGALISLRELISLLPIEASEAQLEEALTRDAALAKRFLVRSGYVIERVPEDGSEAARALEEEEESKRRANENLTTARHFGRLLRRGALLVSVGGANSYLSAGEEEDIDYFCVTRTGHLWTFMLKGLILARIYRMANRNVPELCFSFEMDEAWAERTFRTRQDPIFARDALTVKLIDGKETYHRLLSEATWMSQYFPVLHEERVRETQPGGRGSTRLATARTSVVNFALYYTVGSFLRMKSWALNRRFAKLGERPAEFATKIGVDHCIYESNRYRKLGRMYHELERDG